MDRKRLENIEHWSTFFVLALGYGRILLIFIINIYLLYQLANGISAASGLPTTRIWASLIGASILGITYPMTKSKLEDYIRDKAPLSVINRYKWTIMLLIVSISSIQLAVFINTIYIAFAFEKTKNMIMELGWAVVNQFAGIIVDFVLGAEISTKIEEFKMIPKELKEIKLEVTKNTDSKEVSVIKK